MAICVWDPWPEMVLQLLRGFLCASADAGWGRAGASKGPSLKALEMRGGT